MGANAGVFKGLSFGFEEGVAWDDAGVTHFTLHKVILPDLADPNYVFGADVNFSSISYKYSLKGAFPFTLSDSDYDPGLLGGDLSEISAKYKVGLGLNLSTSDKAFKLSLGVSAGFSMSKTGDDVLESVSITREELEMLGVLEFSPNVTWSVSVEDMVPVIRGGKVVGLKSYFVFELTEQDMCPSCGNEAMAKKNPGENPGYTARITTTLELFMDANNMNVWYSENYMKEAIKAQGRYIENEKQAKKRAEKVSKKWLDRNNSWVW